MAVTSDRSKIQEVRYLEGGGPDSGKTFGYDVDGKTFPTYAEAKGYADSFLLTMRAKDKRRS